MVTESSSPMRINAFGTKRAGLFEASEVNLSGSMEKPSINPPPSKAPVFRKSRRLMLTIPFMTSLLSPLYHQVPQSTRDEWRGEFFYKYRNGKCSRSLPDLCRHRSGRGSFS